MILYTIFDPNMIFNHEGYGQSQTGNVKSEMIFEGVMLEVSQINPSDLRIERIISTNPGDYLKHKIQPGNIIKRQ